MGEGVPLTETEKERSIQKGREGEGTNNARATWKNHKESYFSIYA